MGADLGLIFVVELLSNSGHLSALEVSDFDRTPPLGSARHGTEHQLQDRVFAEGVRDDLEAPAFLDEQTLKQIRGADRTAMCHREAQVGDASFKVVHEARDGTL